MVNKSRRMRRSKKKGTSNNYFTQETESAILRFQVEPDVVKQKEIFVQDIRPAFDKLIENIIFVYQFHTLGNVDVLKNDCMSFLFESLSKFDKSRGSKAFSYYNVVTRNWFSQQKKNHGKKVKSDVHFDQAMLSNLEKNNHTSFVYSYEDQIFYKEFLEILKKDLKFWRSKFDKPQEKMVLEAVIFLFDNPEILPLYNKKGIYMYLREICGMSTKQIVTNLTKFRKKYAHLRARYLDGEI